ncbi:DgyrCDS3360 [Dimorphilus gyrociliatus]|uniref:non-specific serine/threonine protein kinase n=1 Tax=Dimorphilus gyrociliatus TaxID=2664684 RepID=A0A7I8VDF3_9ANNE|nr:DgyrCDS3360 [Dimorphilus gyrociliatus]
MSNNLESQELELKALQAMFEEDITDLRNDDPWKIKRPPDIKINLKPIASSSSKVYVSVEFHIKLSSSYPKDLPEILEISDNKGLSESSIKKLEKEIREKAEEKQGEEIMFELISLIQRYLQEVNVPPKKSFHDDMIERKAEESRERVREGIKLAQEKEILKKQEEDELQEAMERRMNEARQKRKEAKTYRFQNSRGSESDGSRSSSRPRRRSDTPDLENSPTEVRCVSFPMKKSAEIKVNLGQCLVRTDCHSTFLGFRLDSGKKAIINEWNFIWRIPKRKRKTVEEKEQDACVSKKINEKISVFEHEYNTVLKLQHPLLILYLSLLKTEEQGKITVNLLREDSYGINLKSLHLINNNPASIETIKIYVQQLTEVLAYLHSKSVIHGDLTPWCIWINDSGCLKLSDYSLKSSLDRTYAEFENDKIGSHFELLDVLPVVGKGKRADIYRLGITMLSVYTGCLQAKHNPDYPSNIPNNFKLFLDSCFSNKNITISHLGQHMFLNDSNDKEISGNNEKLEAVGESVIVTEKEIIPYVGFRLKQEFSVLDSLGKGGFGEVIKVQNKLDERFYAIKCIKLSKKNISVTRKMLQEVKLLSRFNHENVVRYFNSWKEEVIEEESENSSISTNTITSDNDDQFFVNRKKNEDSLLPSRLNFSASDHVIHTSSHSSWSRSVSNFDESDDEKEDFLSDLGQSFLFLPDNEKDDSIVFESPSNKENFNEPSKSNNPELDQVNSDDSPKTTVYLYIQMEYCDKSTLRTVIDEGLYMNEQRMWKMFREILEGLSHIHEKGMIHRDLKPANIFIDSNDHIKIGDFGLATMGILSTKEANQEADITEPNIPENSSMTGKVGTVFYVSPEVMENLGRYDQKVDMFSLGIIFFEMNYKPLKTAMERHKVITEVRNQRFPTNFEKNKPNSLIKILQGLLENDPIKRVSCKDLLQGDLVPVQTEKVEEIIKAAVEQSGGKSSRYILNTLFQQKVARVDDITYDLHIQHPSVSFCVLHQKTVDTLTNLFRKHSAVYLKTPLLVPRSETYQANCPQFLDCNGTCLCLPYDLRTSFARYVAKHSIFDIKRYYIGNVYRKCEDERAHPKELFEVAFDIVCNQAFTLTADSEILLLLLDVLREFEMCSRDKLTLTLSHSDLTRGLFNIFGIAEDKHLAILKLFSEIKNKITKNDINDIADTSLSERDVQRLKSCLQIEGESVQDFSSKLANEIRNRHSTNDQKMIKSALKHIEQVLEIKKATENYFQNIPSIRIGFLNSTSLAKFNGIMLQLSKSITKGKRFDTIAVGGRYDNLLKNVVLKQKMENVGAVGISFNFDRLKEVLGKHGENCAIYDVLISCISDLDKTSCLLFQLANNLRQLDFKVDIVFTSNLSPNDINELFRKNGVVHVISALPSKEDFDCKVRSFIMEKIIEKTVSVKTVPNYLSALRSKEKEDTSDPYQSYNKSSISGTLGYEYMPNFKSSNAPADYTVSYFSYIGDKLSHGMKKKHDHQITAQMSKILININPKAKCEVLVTDLDFSVIKTIAVYLDYVSDHKEQFHQSVTQVLEKHQRHRKYILDFCDEIYKARNKYQQPPVIVLFCINSDGSYYKLLI